MTSHCRFFSLFASCAFLYLFTQLTVVITNQQSARLTCENFSYEQEKESSCESEQDTKQEYQSKFLSNLEEALSVLETNFEKIQKNETETKQSEEIRKNEALRNLLKELEDKIKNELFLLPESPQTKILADKVEVLRTKIHDVTKIKASISTILQQSSTVKSPVQAVNVIAKYTEIFSTLQKQKDLAFEENKFENYESISKDMEEFYIQFENEMHYNNILKRFFLTFDDEYIDIKHQFLFAKKTIANSSNLWKIHLRTLDEIRTKKKYPSGLSLKLLKKTRLFQWMLNLYLYFWPIRLHPSNMMAETFL